MQLHALPTVLEQYERDHGVSVSIMFHSDGSGTLLIYEGEDQAVESVQDDMLEAALEDMEDMTDEELEELEADEEDNLDDATELLHGTELYATTHKVYFDSIRELGGLLVLPPAFGDHKLN